MYGVGYSYQSSVYGLSQIDNSDETGCGSELSKILFKYGNTGHGYDKI